MRTTWFALVLGPPLLCAPAARARAEAPAAPEKAAGQSDAPPPQAGAAPSTPALASAQDAPGVTPEDLRALREELARVRREADENRRQQEERIRALEQKLQDLQKPAPAPSPAAPPTPAPNPVTTRPGFKARFYGFARADVDVDSRKMFAGSQLPFWVLSPADPRGRNP